MGRFLPGKGSKSGLFSVLIEFNMNTNWALPFFYTMRTQKGQVGLRVDVQFYLETKVQNYDTIV
jgi:hypothetical protein